MINNVVLVGRLTKDPELNETANGIAFCKFTLAVDRPYKNDGKTADFIPIITWRVQAENCGKYLKKGSLAGVEGSIEINTYEANDGTKRYSFQINANRVKFLSTKSNNDDEYEEKPQQAEQTLPNKKKFDDQLTLLETDDLPF
jgi:single-strand DNA-binding protein